MSEPKVHVVTDLPAPKRNYFTKKNVLIGTALAVTAVVSFKVARSEMFASAENVADVIAS